MQLKYSLKYETIINFMFLTNALIIIGNINGILYGVLGIKAPLSPIILLNSITITGLLFFKLKPRGRFGFLVWYFLFFIIMFITLGLASGLFFWQEYHPKASVDGGLRRVLPSMIIFYSTYLYFNYQVQVGKLSKLIGQLTIISFLTVLMIIFGDAVGITTEISGNKDAGRASGLFANPNGAGLAANYCLGLALTCLFLDKKGLVLWIGIVSASIYASVITFSKAAILVTVLLLLLYPGFLLFSFLKTSFYQKVKLVSIGVIFISSIGFTVVKLQNYLGSLDYHQLQRIEHTVALLSGEINEKTTSERSFLWEKAWNRIADNPIFGYGLESFHRFPDSGLGVHNSFLMIWGEGGIISIFLFVSFLGLLVVGAFKLKSKIGSALILGLVLIFSAQDAFTGHNALENRLSIMMLALCTALIFHKNKRIV